MPDKSFWDQRYTDQDTGWDAGSITTPLRTYIDQLSDKDIKILIPGAGNAHEAEYLHRNGFERTYVADISEHPLENLKLRYEAFPQHQLLLVDFFAMEEHAFDLVLEQTFFCALDPQLRPAYAQKMSKVLKPGGKLVGLLFDDALNEDKPPYGGTREEYISYFSPYFEMKVFKRCYNSIPPRAGRELFMILINK